MVRISRHVPTTRPGLGLRGRAAQSRPGRPFDEAAHAEQMVSEGYADMRRLYLWALAFRFGAGMLGWLLTLLVNIPFLQDAFYYEETGAGIARDWLAGRSSEWLSAAMDADRVSWFLPTVIGGFYWLSGGIRLIPLLLLGICAITALTPALTYLIAREVGLSRTGANFAGGLVAFSPAFAFWSGGFYKEGFILLLLNLSIYQVIRLQRQWRWNSLLILAACLFGLFGLRFYLAAMLSVIVLLGLLLGRSTAGEGALTMMRQVLILAGFVGLFFGLGFTERLRRIVPGDFSEALGTIEGSRHDLANSADSGFARDLHISGPAEALEFLPTGMGYFMLSPLPWQWGSIRQNLVIPETAFWIGLYPLIGWGIVRGLKGNFQASALLLAAVVPISCLYALFCGNIGTAYRMRIQVWLLLAIFAGWGWEAWQARQAAAGRRQVRRWDQIRKREHTGSDSLVPR